MNSLHAYEDALALDGPDYVTLVIEWADNDVATIVNAKEPDRSPGKRRTVATVVSALIAIALAAWWIRRLRAAA